MTLAELAVEAGKDADAYVAIVDEASTAHARWAGNALTSSALTADTRLTVIAVSSDARGTAAGVVSHRGAVDEDAVRAVVAAAERAARTATPAADARPLLTGDAVPASPDWTEAAPTASADVLARFATGLAATFERARMERRLLYGHAEQRRHTTWLASSTGLRLRHVQTAGVVDLTAKTEDGAASTWSGTGAADLGEIDPLPMYEGLSTRLGWGRRRVELPAGRYEVLLSPSCVADLMLRLYRAAGAKDAADARTVFRGPDGGTRIGERLTRAPLTLRSDPHEPGLRCAPFVTARGSADVAQVFADTVSVFDNGLPLSATEWIRDGVLTGLVQTRHSADLTGLPVTPQVGNLVLEGPGEGRSLAEMVATTRRGLLVTSLWYVRDVDPRTLLLTGLTRDGVHLVENGEVVGEANNFRFNESPVDLLGRVTEIGRTERALPRERDDSTPRTAMPALRVADYTMSAVSEAT
ncbi:putative Zn-dependent protease [Actinomadura luteofluorescens]|uniref:Putative Zn-dependent protease n=1 Tax=Actinomadura luteofluorescens TaxID=46163 RepID=A0A7Y9ERA9_9ACTN|nr:metallopeptidase TldD-related protein [Actinomadura luteofluorescens]NYD52518.1 putative Zn-dependent protease [Actinomadura luteofluorescens]